MSLYKTHDRPTSKEIDVQKLPRTKSSLSFVPNLVYVSTVNLIFLKLEAAKPAAAQPWAPRQRGPTVLANLSF
jgi:hypothetical protein